MAQSNVERCPKEMILYAGSDPYTSGSSPSSLSLASPSLSPPTSPEIPLVDDSPSDIGLHEDIFLEDGCKFVMVVGGLGYIGSHTTLELLKEGHNVIIIDDLSNSYASVLTRIATLVTAHCNAEGKTIPAIKFHKIDYRSPAMRYVLDLYSPVRFSGSASKVRTSRISGVIHFAAHKSVDESLRCPLEYYRNNVCGLVDFLFLLQQFGIRRLVFSSSATVYGIKTREGTPLQEDDLVHHETCVERNGEKLFLVPGVKGLTSPYGRTKYFSEAILADIAHSDPTWNIIALRYFNPVGCHESGLLGEDPRQKATNLFPVIAKVLTGKQPILEIFGSDWETRDGTAVRDFIHVVDLARGHIAALDAAMNGKVRQPFRTYNLGTGEGATVLEVVGCIEEASSHKIPLCFSDRREGDVGYCVAATDRVETELGWRAGRRLFHCAKDMWNFITDNGNIQLAGRAQTL